MGEVHRRKPLLYYSADEMFLMSRWKTFLSPLSGCWHAGHSSSLQLLVVTLCMDSICAFNLEYNNVQKWKVKEAELRNTTVLSVLQCRKSEKDLMWIVSRWINNVSFCRSGLWLIGRLLLGHKTRGRIDSGWDTVSSYYKYISWQSGVTIMNIKCHTLVSSADDSLYRKSMV